MKKWTYIVVDASPIGLGAMLCQQSSTGTDTKVIAYASRTLTAVESQYSQIERELLAIRWAVAHFHLYLLGADFIVQTDHKPLVAMFRNRTCRPLARIERWMLWLQQYRFQVQHIP